MSPCAQPPPPPHHLFAVVQLFNQLVDRLAHHAGAVVCVQDVELGRQLAARKVRHVLPVRAAAALPWRERSRALEGTQQGLGGNAAGPQRGCSRASEGMHPRLTWGHLECTGASFDTPRLTCV
eukprot:364836-Chlamydomonas_euryale.AAC.12